MEALHLRLGRTKMYGIKAFFNVFSVRLEIILITFLCIGFLFGCSPEVNYPDINFPNFPWTGFKNGDSYFEAEKTFEAEFPVENHIRFSIEAINGEVVVTGHGDADRVLVTAQQYVGSHSQEDAERHIDDLEIVVNKSADEILIQTVQPKHFDGRKYFVEYDIIVPSSLEVMTTQDNGSILIYDIKNSVDVSNVNGEILLSNIAGGVAADVVNGSIEATVILPVNKAINLVANNGSIELSIPMSTSAEFSATVLNGEIIVSDLDITGLVNTKRWLDGVIGDGEGTIELGTFNGNIEVIGFD